MSPPPIAAAVAVLAALGLGAGVVVKSGQHRTSVSSETLPDQLSQQLLKSTGLKPKEAACKEVLGGLKLAGARCFLIPVDPDHLLPLVKKAADSLGTTPGWTNDYSVWGAYYAARGNPQLTFGINIEVVEDNPTLAGLAVIKGYASLLTLVVDARHRSD